VLDPTQLFKKYLTCYKSLYLKTYFVVDNIQSHIAWKSTENPVNGALSEAIDFLCILRLKRMITLLEKAVVRLVRRYKPEDHAKAISNGI
jgi:hypothetical protein